MEKIHSIDYHLMIGSVYIGTSSKVYFDKLKWDSSSRGASEYWEGELRGVDDPSDIGDAYEEPTAVAGSLPYLYK